MGVSTRPSHTRRQMKAPTQRRLAAFFFATLIACSPVTMKQSQAALTAEQLMQKGAVTGSLAPDAAHEVSILQATPGEEQLMLSARLTPVSVNLAKDVTWAVRDANGELQFEETATEAARRLAPGEYIVEAQYGSVAIRQTVTLVPGNSVSISFVLNAGGLRVLPAMQGLPSKGLESQVLVYAMAGLSQGKLVANSNRPGELLKLPAGPYRVETRLGAGNASAVADVNINPGKLSALEINLHAGLARLSFVGSPEAEVNWTIKPEQGPAIAHFIGLDGQVPLKPGNYTAEAHVNGETLTASFTIADGEQRDIVLGN